MEREQFLSWLKDNTNLSDSTMGKYASAINIISSELGKHDLIKGSLYNVNNSELVGQLSERYLSIPEYNEKDTRGNRMYSNALRYYKNFVESYNEENSTVTNIQLEESMIKDLLIKLAERTKVVYTLSTNKKNWITKADRTGICVETEASREKYSNGDKGDPSEFISIDFIITGWQEFIHNRMATAKSFLKTKGRTSFLMAFFAELPFVEIANIDGTSAIKLKEFKTDDLPNEQFHKVMEFLNEVISGVYDPTNLSKQTSGNLYRIKSRGRQDLRMIGIINENNQLNEPLLEEYKNSADKLQFIRELVLMNEYFQMVLYVLDLLRDFSKNDKRATLEEIGMIIVQNSRGENQMVPSVAKERTLNLLTWLETLDLIDHDWSPKGYVISLLKNVGTSAYNGVSYFLNVQDKKKEYDSKINVVDLINHIHTYITSKGFYYSREEVINLFLSLKTKPFVILSGISGTGKTKIVRLFAESLGATKKNGQLEMIPIRPDWNEGSDLLGYVDIKGEFKEGPLTRVIRQASETPYLPFFVLLDEMNLARVEYYFSDILSVMESRAWEKDDIVTDKLLPKEITGFDEDLSIPSNLYIIGTVNMDETTHPFSKKVLDRANSIEFNRVELSNLSFFIKVEEVFPIPVFNEKLASKYLYLKDLYQTHPDLVKKTSEELEKINQSLWVMNAQVGYRVRDEICFYLAYNEEDQLMTYENALDHCILQKILPRIAGSDSRVDKLLNELYKLFTSKEYVEDQDTYEWNLKTAKYPHSARKVVEMLRRLRDDNFTSFWIS